MFNFLRSAGKKQSDKGTAPNPNAGPGNKSVGEDVRMLLAGFVIPPLAEKIIQSIPEKDYKKIIGDKEALLKVIMGALPFTLHRVTHLSPLADYIVMELSGELRDAMDARKKDITRNPASQSDEANKARVKLLKVVAEHHGKKGEKIFEAFDSLFEGLENEEKLRMYGFLNTMTPDDLSLFLSLSKDAQEAFVAHIHKDIKTVQLETFSEYWGKFFVGVKKVLIRTEEIVVKQTEAFDKRFEPGSPLDKKADTFSEWAEKF